MNNNIQQKIRWCLILAYGISTLMLLAVTIGYLLRPPVSVVSKLEEAVARVPIGIDAADADVLMGGAPQEIATARGVLMNSVTMLSEENSLAPNFGPPQDYSLRIWREGHSAATVVIDAEGKVAGHWGWNVED